MLCPKLCGSAAIDYVDYMAVHWDIVTGRAGRFLRGRFFCPVYSGKRGVGVRVRCWGETPGPLLLVFGVLACGDGIELWNARCRNLRTSSKLSELAAACAVTIRQRCRNMVGIS